MKTILVSLLGLVFLAGGLAAPAQAAAPRVVSGKVQCINGAGPVGIWVNAKNGGSGWATMGYNVADGWGYHRYKYRLPRGGAYSLNVGCGGTPKRWGITAKTGVVTAARNNFRCNDIHPALDLARKILGLWRGVDLTRGIAYKTCKRI